MVTQQKIISIDYHQLKGLRDIKISFEPNQVTGIFGVNGCGKSTILHSLLCFYQPEENVNTVNYWFSNFFKTSSDMNWLGSSMTVEMSYREGDVVKKEKKNYRKDKNRWAPKYGSRPVRSVYFLGVNSCVPDIEEFSKSSSNVEFETPEGINKRDEILRAASSVMNFNYTDLKYQRVKSQNRKCRLVNKGSAGTDISYTSLNMGAGEQRVFRIIEMMVNVPKYSLVVIDEIDLTLHTAALNRLMDFIVKIAKDKKIQVVFTSHREELVNRTDINIRHLLQTNNKTLCLENTTPECIDRITGNTERTLDLFVEDDLAEAIVAKICSEINIRKRVAIHRFGAIDNAFVASVGLDILGKDTNNTLFVLDGDRYRTDEEKKRIMKKKYSGDEEGKDKQREQALSRIKQFFLPEGKSPEEYICDVLKAGESDSEIARCAKDIQGTLERHDYLNKIIESIGEDRKICLKNIVDEFSQNTEEWNKMTKNVAEWLNKKKAENSL